MAKSEGNIPPDKKTLVKYIARMNRRTQYLIGIAVPIVAAVTYFTDPLDRLMCVLFAFGVALVSVLRKDDESA